MNTLFAFFDEIGGKIAEFIQKYLQIAFDWLLALPWWVQALIIIALAVIVVLGVIKFVEVSWKLFLVLIVLAGIAAAVYYLVIKPGETTTTEVVEAIFNASSFLKLLI